MLNFLQVRAAVIEMLGSWTKAAGPSILPDVVGWISSPKCNADGRKEVLVWMTDQIREGKIGKNVCAQR